MNIAEVGATPYGGKWWRRDDEDIIQLFDPEAGGWRVWDGRLFGAYPPPELFEGAEGKSVDEGPTTSGPPSLMILRISAVVFAVSAAIHFAISVYFALKEAPVSLGIPQTSELDVNLTKIQGIVSPLWELAVATMIATACLVIYRYLERRSET